LTTIEIPRIIEDSPRPFRSITSPGDRPKPRWAPQGLHAVATLGARLMRDHLLLHINGKRQVVNGRDAFFSLSDFLRRRLGLVGTKIVCSEGDCGACTALIGRPNRERTELTYRPVNSCIQFMFQLDGAHVVTVEGLRPDADAIDMALSGVQQAMVDCHGSQCGFCTPGFVMAMTGLLEADDAPDETDWRHGLTGNLCRCTGYVPILDAAAQACESDHQRLNDLYPPAPILADLVPYTSDPLELTSPKTPASPLQRAACPADLPEALAFLANNPTARIIAGATDVGVRANKSGRLPDTILDLNRVAELDFVRLENNTLIAGARATWTALLHVCGLACPEFARILAIFGAPQIRHVGTIGGNIANASPIADSLPFLYVTEATLILASAAGRREVNINNFYRGYKQLDLRPGELIAEIRIPLPAPDELLRLYKVSRRRDLDISTFTAAVRLRLSAETIESASIAFGGVGPTVFRARRTESFLLGQPFTEGTMRRAAELASSEVTPISDVRGAADYRRQLTHNILLKFYFEHQSESAVV
jgi:xanthine dehydrogenase small subunit